MRRLFHIPDPLYRWVQFLAAAATFAVIAFVPICAVWTKVLPARLTGGPAGSGRTIAGDKLTLFSVFPHASPDAFSLSAEGIEARADGTYDYDQYADRPRATMANGGIEPPRPVLGILGLSDFGMSFALGNGRDADTAIVRKAVVKIDHFQPIATHGPLGCLPAYGRGGGNDPIMGFRANVSPVAEKEQPLQLDNPTGTIPRIDPNDVLIFSGQLDFEEPGDYTLHARVYYDTSSGQGLDVTSGSVEFVVLSRELAHLSFPLSKRTWVAGELDRCRRSLNAQGQVQST